VLGVLRHVLFPRQLRALLQLDAAFVVARFKAVWPAELIDSAAWLAEFRRLRGRPGS